MTLQINLDGPTWRVACADRPVTVDPPTVAVTPVPESLVAAYTPVEVAVGGGPAETWVASRPAGQEEWVSVGPVDGAATVVRVPTPYPAGGDVEIAAVTRGPGGRTAYATTVHRLGDEVGPGTEFTAVGNFQRAAGCPSNDSPTCPDTRLTDPDGDGTYTWTSPPLGEGGGYRVRVAVGPDGRELYGESGEVGGDAAGATWFDFGPRPITVSFTPRTRRLDITLNW